MVKTIEDLAFNRGVQPMLEIVLRNNVEEVLHYCSDPDLQLRIEELARKSNEGGLTADERAEYVGYLRANKFVGILKRQAMHLQV